MRFLGAVLAAILCVWAWGATRVTAQTPQQVHVVDLVPSFLAAVEDAQRAKPDARVAAFRAAFIVPNAALLQSLGMADGSDADIARALEATQPLIPVMRRLDAQLAPPQVTGAMQALDHVLSGFSWHGTLYVLPIDGGWSTGPVGGTPAIVAGMSTLAAAEPDANLVAQFEGQAAQLYLAQIMPEFANAGSLYQIAWEEGFGLHVARILNPGVAFSALAPPSISSQGAAYLPEAAKLFLTAFDSQDANVVNALFAPGDSFSFYPPDVGDYISDRIAGDLAKERSLRELTALSGSALRAAVSGDLKNLCGADCAAISIAPSARATASGDPAAAHFVTSDVTKFWRAYRDAQANPSRAADIYRHEYFDQGSIGLVDFTPNRLESPEHLVRAIARERAYYAAIEPYTRHFERLRPAVIADFRILKKIYPSAQFPDVYFIVGVMNSGGTLSSDGLMLGAEMHALPPGFSQEQLGAYPIGNLAPAEATAPLVVHELAHFQQRLGNAGNGLLRQTIDEGSADFIAQLVTGVDPDAFAFAYGCSNETQLWARFTHDMSARPDDAVKDWLYSLHPSFGAPRFIGYWVGYRIVQSYYDRANDKAAALREILNFKNADRFLAVSGYPKSLPACRQEHAAPALRRTARVAAVSAD